MVVWWLESRISPLLANKESCIFIYVYICWAPDHGCSGSREYKFASQGDRWQCLEMFGLWKVEGPVFGTWWPQAIDAAKHFAIYSLLQPRKPSCSKWLRCCCREMLPEAKARALKEAARMRCQMRVTGEWQVRVQTGGQAQEKASRVSGSLWGGWAIADVYRVSGGQEESFFFFFVITWFWTQGLVLARLAFYHLSHTSQPFVH
jgi:hypothetical protein